jgi:hypothetical protein
MNKKNFVMKHARGLQISLEIRLWSEAKAKFFSRKFFSFVRSEASSTVFVPKRFSYQNGFRTKTVFVQFCFWYENRFLYEICFLHEIRYSYEKRFCTKSVVLHEKRLRSEIKNMHGFDINICFIPSLSNYFWKKKIDFKKTWRNNARRIFQGSVQDFVRETPHWVVWVRDHFYMVKGVKLAFAAIIKDISGYNLQACRIVVGYNL